MSVPNIVDSEGMGSMASFKQNRRAFNLTFYIIKSTHINYTENEFIRFCAVSSSGL